MERSRSKELYLAAALLTAAVSIAFAPDAYLPMLVRAFIVPASVFLVTLALVFGLRKAWWPAQSALLGAALMILQLPAPGEPTGTGSAVDTLRIFHMNVLQPNTAYQEAIDQALAGDADLISVQEVGPEWAAALVCGLRDRYPFIHLEPRTNCYGIALFSKRPFLEACTISAYGTPFIEALFDVGGETVRVLAVHTTSPISYGHFRRRNAQLNMLGEHLATSDTATIVVGDLNTVPWDSAFRRFCARARLQSTTPSFQRTWPSIGPFAAIPLDHVLVSPTIGTTALRTVEIAGSDHRGVLAEITIRK